MAEQRQFKSISLQELEVAMSEAISKLTGTSAASNIRSVALVSNAIDELNGKQRFDIQITISVGVAYSETSSEGGDLPF